MFSRTERGYISILVVSNGVDQVNTAYYTEQKEEREREKTRKKKIE